MDPPYEVDVDVDAEGEGHAGGRIGPAIGGADAAVPEGARVGDRPQPARGGRFAAGMRAEAAVHGQAHVLVHPVAGEVPRDELHHAGREHAGAVQRAARGQHLVEGRHGAGAAVAAAEQGIEKEVVGEAVDAEADQIQAKDSQAEQKKVEEAKRPEN